ncbi:hypothetical protein KKH05_03445, partial [Patescibacteria group bacterium]|nr:hypothetical protein [Patescibacteria group bacterium]
THHNSNETNKDPAYAVETYPMLTSPNVDKSVGGWGETFYFNVTATDEDNDTMTVYFWFKKNTTETWTQGGSNTTIKGQNVVVYFTKSFFSGADIAGYNFKFNVTEDDSGQTNETATTNFTVEKDDIEVQYVWGNASVVTRIGTNTSATMSVRVYDTDRSLYLSSGVGGKFWVTTDRYTLVLQSSTTTSATGYLNYSSFDPGCSGPKFGIGPQMWIAGVTGESAYKDTNLSFHPNITIWTEPLITEIIDPRNNQNYTRGVDDILIRGNVSDDCGLVNGTTVQLYSQETSTWYPCTPVNDEEDGNYNCTVLAAQHSARPLGPYNTTINATMTNYNDSTTYKEEEAYELSTVPTASFPTVVSDEGGSTGGWGETWDFIITVQDIDADDLNVSLFLNNSGSYLLTNYSTCYACSSSNATTFAAHNFSATDIGSHGFLFNVTDSRNYTVSVNSTFTVEKDDTGVDYIAGNTITIDREGTETGTLILRIKDTDRDVYVNDSVTSAFYITTDNSANPGTSLHNSTNLTGHLIYQFDPNCTFLAGTQAWIGGVTGDDHYEDSNSSDRSLSIRGQLKNNLIIPEFDTEYFVGQQIVINSTLQSDCAVEDNITFTTVNFTFNTSGSPNYVCNTTGAGDFYFCTWNSTNKLEGNYTVNMSAYNANYTSNTTIYQDRFYLNNSEPAYSLSNVTPTEGGWTRNYTYNVYVEDAENNTVWCTLYVSTDNGVSWRNKGTDVLNNNGTCSILVDDFMGTDIGSDNLFRWHINDTTGNNTYNTTDVDNPDLNTANVSIEYVFGDTSFVNRTFGSLPLIVRVFDLENLSYYAGINTTFWITSVNGDLNTSQENSTNSTGHVIYNFQPTCTYSANNQTWKFGITDPYFNNSNTSNFTVNVRGYLNLNITAPNGEEILRGNNVTFNGTVLDDCGTNISTADVSFMTQNSTSIVCTDLVNISDGNYSCEINTTGMNADARKVYFNATLTHHNSNETNKDPAYAVETYPMLTSPNVDKSVGGWGETFYFNVTATD